MGTHKDIYERNPALFESIEEKELQLRDLFDEKEIQALSSALNLYLLGYQACNVCYMYICTYLYTNKHCTADTANRVRMYVCAPDGVGGEKVSPGGGFLTQLSRSRVFTHCRHFTAIKSTPCRVYSRLRAQAGRSIKRILPRTTAHC